MPLYLIERNFAEQVNVTPEIAAAITQVNADAGIQWLYLLPERRQEEDLLPVRGAQPGRYP